MVVVVVVVVVVEAWRKRRWIGAGGIRRDLVLLWGGAGERGRC